LLTTSCTHALELSALLLDLQPGDEVIVPSFTFVSTVNAFVLRGARPVFADIRPDTLNLDEQKLEGLITKKTKAIYVVHYAGVGCEMDAIQNIAHSHKIPIIEDNAHGLFAKYRGRGLGTFGVMATQSFHETKNISCGEGGALLINDGQYVERAEIIREKGTNRSRFFRGQVDKYTWVDLGSSFLPSELNAAYLYGQLTKADEINENRLKSWNFYYEKLYPLFEQRKIEIPIVPKDCVHNAHMFYIKTSDIAERDALIRYLKEHGIETVFHYIPLHSATAGLKFGRFHGDDVYTTKESERLLRLPLYYGLQSEDISKVVASICQFYENRNLKL